MILAIRKLSSTWQFPVKWCGFCLGSAVWHFVLIHSHQPQFQWKSSKRPQPSQHQTADRERGSKSKTSSKGEWGLFKYLLIQLKKILYTNYWINNNNINMMMMTMIKVWLIQVNIRPQWEAWSAVIIDPCVTTVHGNLQDDKAERLQGRNQVSNRN